MKSFVAVALFAAASLVSSRPFVMDKNTDALHPAARAIPEGYPRPYNGTSPYTGKPYQKAKRNWYPQPNGTTWPPHGGY